MQVSFSQFLNIIFFKLGVSHDPGIGIEAAKVVSECIHSSRVKEMGTVLLRKNNSVRRDDDDVLHSYDRLSEDEVQKFQLKLARSLVVFMELLHLLIARNRDLLLDVVQKRKKYGVSKTSKDVSHTSMHRVTSRGDLSHATNHTLSHSTTHTPTRGRPVRGEHARRLSFPTEDVASREDSSVKTNRSSNQDYDPGTVGSSKDGGPDRSRIDPALRTDSAIGIQRELQLAFINIAKELWPMIHGIMESDAPSWLKECCQDNYFSKYSYRRAKIRKSQSKSKYSCIYVLTRTIMIAHALTRVLFLKHFTSAIGEELTFEDVDVMSIDSSTRDVGPVYRLGSISSMNRSDKSYSSQAPDSPGGSIGSNSNMSRGSDTGRSTKTLTSARSQKERQLI